MSRYRLSRQSRLDLDDIWRFIASDNLAAADRLIDELIRKFQTLASEPGIGPDRSELAESLRSFPVGNYVIFYRAMRHGIEIVRVLSGYRDLPDVFSDE